MASRRIDKSDRAAQEFWRQLATRAGWEASAAAQDLGISLRQLERLSQQELGTTPHDFFHRERMAAAARFLADGQPAKVVALQLGYTQPSNFSRDFKRHHGRTPSLFAPRPRLGLTPPPPNPLR